MTGRFKLLVAEAWRSLGANLSTTVAATMTVLISMFLLGLFVAFGTWMNSWSSHVKSELLVKVYFAPSATSAEKNNLGRELQQNQYVAANGVLYVSKEQALADMKRRFPALVAGVAYNPLPDSLQVQPKRGEDIDNLYNSIVKPSGKLPPGVDEGPGREAEVARDPQGGALHRRLLHPRRRRSADRIRAADLEHDPTLDLLATT